MDTETTRRVRAVAQLRAFLRGFYEAPDSEASTLRLAVDVLAAAYSPEAPFLEKFFVGWQSTLFKIAGEKEGPSRAFLEHWRSTPSSQGILEDRPEVRYLLSVGGAIGCDEEGGRICSPLAMIEFGSPSDPWHPMAFVVDEDTYLRESSTSAAMYRLSRSADGSAVKTFSSAGPPPSELATWPQRLTAVLYVSETRGLQEFEDHMAKMSTLQLVNVASAESLPEDLGADVRGLLNVLLNSPDRNSIVPATKAAWEVEAFSGDGDDDDKKPASEGMPAWVVASIAAVSALVLGAGIVIATTARKK